MADPEDRKPLEGVTPGGPPRRQPPTIDVKAVEISLDGSGVASAGTGAGARPSSRTRWPNRILTFLSPPPLVIIGSACVIAGIIAGGLWIYLAPDRNDWPQRNAAGLKAALPDGVTERVAQPETALSAPPSHASLPPHPPPLAGEGDLESRLAALDARLTPLGDHIAALERAVRDAAAAAHVAGERADRAAALFEGAKKGGDEQYRAQQHDANALDDLAGRVAILESRQAALQQKQEGLDRLAKVMTAPDQIARAATLALALRSAVERGGPFAAELAAARSLRLDERALASLEPFAATGLPTPNELFRSLSALVPELRRLSLPPSRELGYLDRLQASAVKMLNIRPVRDEPGDDPAAVMSRIEFKMGQQDIEAMVAELDKLPAPARELAQPWRTKALGRQDAVESALLMATASLAKLGEPAARGPLPQ